MKKNLLKSKMSLYEDNNKTLAKKLSITPSALSRKINGSSNFTIEEMKFIRKEYGLSDGEFLDIFFNNWFAVWQNNIGRRSIKSI